MEASMIAIPPGWFFSETMNSYQKVNNEVYVYIQPMLWGYHHAQLYMRGSTGFCTLEARTERNTHQLFALAESWLEKYNDGNVERLRVDYYHINNLNGAWGVDYDKKAFWI
jgi:hypothetical protein